MLKISLTKQFVYLLLFFCIAILIGCIYSKPIIDNVENNMSLTTWNIFSNNIKAASIIYFGGFISFGVITLFFLFINGFIVGGAIQYNISENGIVHTFLAIAPHGIVEIPAIILSALGGIQMLIITIRLLKSEKFSLKLYVKHMIILLVMVVILLFIASIIEAFITPTLMEQI